MDREVVLAILVALCCGAVLTAAGCCPTGRPVASSGRTLERRAWRRLWLPFGPALFVFAALCGWALVEPACAERVPTCLVWAALPFAGVVARAGWRALRSLIRPPDVAVATLGLLRPRIIVSPCIREALDDDALAAAVEHERAHARHLDPLRLWLAQFGSDLLWPWPAAAARFRCWRNALELARDEEARHSDIAGADLAVAILTLLRRGQRDASLSVPTLGGDESFVEERIGRLLRPLEADAPGSTGSAVWLVAASAGVVLAVFLGAELGERVVRALLTAF